MTAHTIDSADEGDQNCGTVSDNIRKREKKFRKRKTKFVNNSEDDRDDSIETIDDDKSDVNNHSESERNTDSDYSESCSIGRDSSEFESEETPAESIVESNTFKSKLWIVANIVYIVAIAVAFTGASLLGDVTRLLNPKLSIQEVQPHLDLVDGIIDRYPHSIRPIDIGVIKRRLLVMQKEMSILVLLGKTRDTKCLSDPTFCVGQTIVNATNLNFSYLDAAQPAFGGDDFAKKLSGSFRDDQNVILIDSLEKLPGSQVLNLFPYVDQDQSNKKRGMLLFTIYSSDSDISRASRKPVDITESILLRSWSSSVAKDTLTSMISRLCRSIIKVN